MESDKAKLWKIALLMFKELETGIFRVCVSYLKLEYM